MTQSQSEHDFQNGQPVPAQQVPGFQTAGSVPAQSAGVAPVAGLSDKSFTTALLLSFFLGGLGVDRFYLGYTGLGIAKLLLSWLTVGIWPIVDFVLIATRKVSDVNGRPLR